MIGRRHGHGRFEPTHIDMVPMVDCVMVLVIFLMISSAFVNDPGVEVQKPDVSGAASMEQNILFVAITADNRIYFDGQEIRTDQVADVLKQAGPRRSSSGATARRTWARSRRFTPRRNVRGSNTSSSPRRAPTEDPE
jgi:biopolymer transport protein ExbD